MEVKMTEERKTLADWVREHEKKTGTSLNMGTVRKRRAVAKVGVMVPPKTYLLTYSEFRKVLETPLPMCNKVVSA